MCTIPLQWNSHFFLCKLFVRTVPNLFESNLVAIIFIVPTSRYILVEEEYIELILDITKLCANSFPFTTKIVFLSYFNMTNE